MPPTVFVRDAALAYIQKKTVVQPRLAEKVKKLEQEVETADMYLQPILEKAEALQRLTPRETRRAARIAKRLGHLSQLFSKLLKLIPHDR